MKLNLRNLHRDFGYFYLGLIVSFASSGLLMNHRQSWHPEKYTVQTKAITIKNKIDKKSFTDDAAKEIAKSLAIDDKFRRQNIKEGKLRISFEKNDLEIDLTTSKGELVTFTKTPIIGHAMQLHKNTNNWWIIYSDIFAISLIFIAISGSFILGKTRNSFSSRGWRLTALGLIVPLFFLIFL
jgi:uncharacterized protein